MELLPIHDKLAYFNLIYNRVYSVCLYAEKFPILAILLGSLTLGALSCAGNFSPSPPNEVAFLDRAQTQTKNGITVTAAVLSSEENEQIFGVDLTAKGVQPVWLEIENHSDHPYMFLPIALDPDYFSPNEVSWLNHYSFGRTANEEMDKHFNDYGINTEFLIPGKKISGFVYTNIDPVVKYVNVILFGLDRVERFIFYFEVPGIKTDYQLVDFESLYDDDEIINYEDDDELRKALENLPCCTEDPEGKGGGNPINVIIVGDPENTMPAFIRRNWDVTEAKSEDTRLDFDKIFATARYRTIPMSPLYLFGRSQDIGLQKSRRNEDARLRQRRELRVWLSPLKYRGMPVWIGSVSRDIGSDLRVRKYWFASQEIDPDIDETRDYLVEDIIFSHSVNKIGYVDGVGESTRADPHINLMGQPWWTDGYRAVLIIGEELAVWTDLEFFEWEEIDDGYNPNKLYDVPENEKHSGKALKR